LLAWGRASAVVAQKRTTAAGSENFMVRAGGPAI
jgi:hypothetical protein